MGLVSGLQRLWLLEMGTALKSSKKFTFLIRLVYCIPPSPITLVSKVNSGEYKLMGLAPYGKPRYSKVILDNIINVAEDGSFQINMQYFDFATGLRMTNKKFHRLFGGEPRGPETEITQREMDLAASIQFVTEEIVTKIARNIAKETGEKTFVWREGWL